MDGSERLGPLPSKRVHAGDAPGTPKVQRLATNMLRLNLEGQRVPCLSSVAPPLRRASQRRVSAVMPSAGQSSAAVDAYNKGSSYASIKMHSDSRDIKQPAFQHAAARAIIDYLKRQNYPAPLTARTLRDMASRDFQAIFKFLHTHIDPNYSYGRAKFEDEIIGILRSLKYPLADTISSKAMYSIAAPHSYPTFLALLLWMTDMCKEFDAQVDHVNGALAKWEKVSDKQELGPDDMDMLFFDYARTCYNVYMQGGDDDALTPINRELRSVFDGITQGTLDHCRQVIANHENFKKQLDDLKNNPTPYERQQKIRQTIDADRANIMTFIEKRKNGAKILDDEILQLKVNARKHEGHVEKFTKMRDELAASLKDNAISNDQIDRETAQLSLMEQESADLQQKLADTQDESTTKEHALDRKRHEITNAVRTYNDTISPLAQLSSKISNIVVPSILGSQVRFDPAAADLDHLLSHDLENATLPAIKELGGELKEKYLHGKERLMERKEEWRSQLSSLRDKDQEIKVLEDSLYMKQRDHEAGQDAFRRENDNYVATMAKADQRIREARTTVANELYASRQQEKELAME
ncbi:HEC/Ndc80p family-domain-containing protein [Gongronella butleri]|nr:HEC/Ndc80p family-domain-containing protein [Gongronella butleri]